MGEGQEFSLTILGSEILYFFEKKLKQFLKENYELVNIEWQFFFLYCIGYGLLFSLFICISLDVDQEMFFVLQNLTRKDF